MGVGSSVVLGVTSDAYILSELEAVTLGVAECGDARWDVRLRFTKLDHLPSILLDQRLHVLDPCTANPAYFTYPRIRVVVQRVEER